MSLLMRRGIFSSAKGGIFAANTADLNGTTQYFNRDGLGAFSAFTVNYWINPNNTSNTYKYLGIADSDNTSLCWVGSGNAGQFSDIDFGVNSIADDGIKAVDTANYKMYTITYDGANGKLYEDGIQIGSDIASVFSITNLKLHIGKRAWASSGFTPACYGFAGLWSEALSPTVILSMCDGGQALCYDALTTTQKTDMISYWHIADFTGMTGTEIEDRHGSNDLTNNSSIPFTGTGLNVQC